MKKALFGFMALGLMILMASAYSITRLQMQAAPIAVESVEHQDLTNISQIESSIQRLKSEMAEVEKLEEKIRSAPLNKALSLGAELNEKLKIYGSKQTLQASLQLLTELKSDFDGTKSQDLKTSTSENIEL